MHMGHPLLFAGLALCVLGPTDVYAQHGHDDPEAVAIRHVVVSGYVEGMHKNSGRAAVRKAFHPDFVMTVLQGDAVTTVSIEEWISRLPPEGTPPEHEIDYEIPSVVRTGNAAVATVHLYQDGNHVFTDYIGLYKFPEGWRMVNKIFFRVPPQS